MGYRVQLAEPHHTEALPAIERAAAALFESDPHVDVDPADATSLEELQEAERSGQLWVALGEDDRPVGFAYAHRHGGYAHLEEIDVHPDHGRRGLGARLLRAVCEFAAGEGLLGTTLTTFRDVAWNAPFYRRHGFEVVPESELMPWMREILEEEEVDGGLDRAQRVFMRRPA